MAFVLRTSTGQPPTQLCPMRSDKVQGGRSWASIRKSPALSRISVSEDRIGVLGDCTSQMLRGRPAHRR